MTSLAISNSLREHFVQFVRTAGADEMVSALAGELVAAVEDKHVALEVVKSGDRALREKLLASPVIGSPLDGKPIVLDDSGRLYLRRFYSYEQAVVRRLHALAIPATAAGDTDSQQAAVQISGHAKFLVVTGGPGTGKTTVAARILAELAKHANQGKVQCLLAAPTGKAAARLQQAIRTEISRMNLPDEVREAIPQTATTVHRMLGAIGEGSKFRRNRENPLVADAVLIDEASMIPLPLMAKLLDALPETTQLILLGDSEQLASVDPGAVFGDITLAAETNGSPLAGNVVRLTVNHRFKEGSGIYEWGKAVRAGDARAVLELADLNSADAEFRDLPSGQAFRSALAASILPKLLPLVQAADPAAALGAMNAFRILCAIRSGPFGVEALNTELIRLLREGGNLESGKVMVPGLPILILRNDPIAGLLNGDTGIFLPDTNDGGRLWAWFEDENGQPRRVPASRLPEWEPAFAMTVHKSQGSEFQDVLFILPQQDSPVVTRELIYTGITRARSHIEIWANRDVLLAGVESRQRRVSGLAEALLKR